MRRDFCGERLRAPARGLAQPYANGPGAPQEHRLQLRAMMEALIDCMRFPADAPAHLANGGGAAVPAAAAAAAASSEAQVTPGRHAPAGRPAPARSMLRRLSWGCLDVHERLCCKPGGLRERAGRRGPAEARCRARRERAAAGARRRP